MPIIWISGSGNGAAHPASLLSTSRPLTCTIDSGSSRWLPELLYLASKRSLAKRARWKCPRLVHESCQWRLRLRAVPQCSRFPRWPGACACVAAHEGPHPRPPLSRSRTKGRSSLLDTVPSCCVAGSDLGLVKRAEWEEEAVGLGRRDGWPGAAAMLYGSQLASERRHRRRRFEATSKRVPEKSKREARAHRSQSTAPSD